MGKSRGAGLDWDQTMRSAACQKTEKKIHFSLEVTKLPELGKLGTERAGPTRMDTTDRKYSGLTHPSTEEQKEMVT